MLARLGSLRTGNARDILKVSHRVALANALDSISKSKVCVLKTNDLQENKTF